jgi:glycosyltransferase involved in cell wall biosynthesis
MPKFSVVIPLYNKENFISEILHSVLAQSYADFEVIVVDDCSTDKSTDKVNAISDHRIRVVIHRQNKGLSASRNTGIKESKSQYIAFLDADDLWKPEFLETIDFLIERYPEASLFGTKYEVNLDGQKVIEYAFNIKEFDEHGIIPNFFDYSRNYALYNQSCFCAKKEVFEKVGYYNEKVNYSEDVDFNIRAYAEHSLAYFNKALATYFMVSENQITQGSLLGKTIPDYDYYEEKFKDRADIKKYLDFQRYVKAKQFKLSGDMITFRKLVSKIDRKNINFKQRLLLQLPNFLLRLIGFTKQNLQKKGIELNTYSS